MKDSKKSKLRIEHAEPGDTYRDHLLYVLYLVKIIC